MSISHLPAPAFLFAEAIMWTQSWTWCPWLFNRVRWARDADASYGLPANTTTCVSRAASCASCHSNRSWITSCWTSMGVPLETWQKESDLWWFVFWKTFSIRFRRIAKSWESSKHLKAKCDEWDLLILCKKTLNLFWGLQLGLQAAYVSCLGLASKSQFAEGWVKGPRSSSPRTAKMGSLADVLPALGPGSQPRFVAHKQIQ